MRKSRKEQPEDQQRIGCTTLRRCICMNITVWNNATTSRVPTPRHGRNMKIL